MDLWEAIDDMLCDMVSGQDCQGEEATRLLANETLTLFRQLRSEQEPS